MKGDERDAPVLRARRFELVDNRGRVRAVLDDVSTDPDQYGPGLTLFDEDGRVSIELVVLSAEGPQLSLAAGGNGMVEIEPQTSTPRTRGPNSPIACAPRVVAADLPQIGSPAR
jgi:hypothetical protein